MSSEEAQQAGESGPRTVPAAALTSFALERMSLVIAALGFALLVVKVSRVSHLNSRTSLGLLGSVGPVEVVLGAVVAELTFFLFVFTAVTLWWASGSYVSTRTVTQGHMAAIGVLALALLVLPWPFFVAAAVIGAIGFVVRRLRPIPAAADTVVGRRRRRGYYMLGALLAIVLLADAEMWLPSEQFTMIDGREIVGYALEEPSNAEAWIEILTENEREIVHLRQSAVEERVACRIPRGDLEPESFASVYQLTIGEDPGLHEVACPEGDPAE